VAQLIIGVVMLATVPIVFLKPIMGRVISLREIGVQRNDLSRLARIGLIGFVLEIPISVLLAAVGQALFSGIHHSTHPTTVAISTRHDLLTLVSTFMLASIVAPFWEEIMFRGLLFPAISRVTGRVLIGALVSSFFFGALHPQGLPLWMALMSVAGMSCALSYYTKSLVPSMVMHAAHNTALLVLTILFS
jgi:membrane protease YdiL (CAAX protease family)